MSFPAARLCSGLFGYEVQSLIRVHNSVPKNGWVAQESDVLPNGGPRIEKGDR